MLNGQVQLPQVDDGVLRHLILALYVLQLPIATYLSNLVGVLLSMINIMPQCLVKHRCRLYSQQIAFVYFVIQKEILGYQLLGSVELDRLLAIDINAESWLGQWLLSL